MKTFDELPKQIHRIDTVRYMYLHYYGGVYVDLDFECLKPMDEYLKGKQLVLGIMGLNKNRPHSIPNALMASRPRHSFWIKVLNYIHIFRNRKWSAELVDQMYFYF